MISSRLLWRDCVKGPHECSSPHLRPRSGIIVCRCVDLADGLEAMVYAHARAPLPASRAHPHECRTGAMTSAMGAFACSIGRLSLGNMPSTEYTLRQRVALVLEASVTAETLVAMPDDDIHHAFLMEPAHLAHAAARGPGDAAAAQGARHAHGRRPRRARLHHAAPAGRGVVRGRHRGLRRARAARRVPGHEQRRRRPRGLGAGRASWASTWACCCCSAPASRAPRARCWRSTSHARRVPPETLLETGLRAADLARSGSPRPACARTPSPRTRSCRCWAFISLRKPTPQTNDYPPTTRTRSDPRPFGLARWHAFLGSLGSGLLGLLLAWAPCGSSPPRARSPSPRRVACSRCPPPLGSTWPSPCRASSRAPAGSRAPAEKISCT